VTRSSNCSRSSRKRGTSTSLWGIRCLSVQCSLLYGPRYRRRRADSKADFVEFIEHRGFEETDSHAKESLLVSLGVRIIIGFIVPLSPAGVFSFLLNQPHSRLESVRCPSSKRSILLNPSLTNRLHPTLQGNLERFAVHSPTHSTQRCIPGTTTQWSTLERCSPFLAIPPRAGVDDYSRQTVVEVFRERHTRNRH